jgi:hypothetical protein
MQLATAEELMVDAPTAIMETDVWKWIEHQKTISYTRDRHHERQAERAFRVRALNRPEAKTRRAVANDFEEAADFDRLVFIKSLRPPRHQYRIARRSVLAGL